MCNKISYPTRAAALQDIKAQHLSIRCTKYKANAKMQRKSHPYQCPICGKWHTTRLAKNIVKRLAKKQEARLCQLA